MSDELDDLLETNSTAKSEKTAPPRPSISADLLQHLPAKDNPSPKDNSPISTDSDEITYSPSRVTNYAALKTTAMFFKVLSWITGVGGIFSIIYSLSFTGGRYGPDVEFYVYLVMGMIALYISAQSSFSSESINVILDIEANSRQAAKTLERLLKSQ